MVDVLKFVGRYAARKRAVCICRPFDPGGEGRATHKSAAPKKERKVPTLRWETLIVRAKLSRKPVAAAV